MTELEITLDFIDEPVTAEFYAIAGAPGRDGAPGADGQDGADGHTPVITASKQGHRTTVYVDGSAVAQIDDGADGAAGQDGHTPVKGTDYWTAADKAEIVEDVTEEIDLSNYVQKTDYASDSQYGLVKTNSNNGIRITADHVLAIARASSGHVKGGIEGSNPITPTVQHESTFYGLAKAAGDTTQSQSDNTVGTYTDGAKSAIRTMLGAVGTTDYATTSAAGVVKAGTGLYMGAGSSSGKLYIDQASPARIKAGNTSYYPIVPERQHESTFYGLAKAAGDTTQALSNNAVGIYTDDAKSAIRTMLGAVGTEDYASTTKAGIVQILNYAGLYITSTNKLAVNFGGAQTIKDGTLDHSALCVARQHISTFYGLAKAAGDSTQSASSNTVGNYTDAAKVAIQKMLGIYEAPWELIREDTITNEAEAAYDIIVDDNGQAFELTDIVLHLRAEGSGASKFGSYGQVEFFDLVKNKSAVLEAGAWDVASGGNRGCYFIAYQSNGLLMTGETQGAAGTAPSPLRFRQYVGDPSSYLNGFELAGQSPFVFSQIRIRSIKGSFKIEVFGKRKWQ